MEQCELLAFTDLGKKVSSISSPICAGVRGIFYWDGFVACCRENAVI